MADSRYLEIEKITINRQWFDWFLTEFGTMTYMDPVNPIGCKNFDFLANVNSRSRSLYAVARPSVVCLSVTLVHPTQAVQIFGNISTAFGTLAIR